MHMHTHVVCFAESLQALLIFIHLLESMLMREKPAMITVL